MIEMGLILKEEGNFFQLIIAARRQPYGNFSCQNLSEISKDL
jgi:hypothetical protein